VYQRTIAATSIIFWTNGVAGRVKKRCDLHVNEYAV
jgi:hypothetical protein